MVAFPIDARNTLEIRLKTALPLALNVLGVLSALTLAGCVSTKESYTAEGNMVYSVSCRFQPVDNCLEEAGKTCGTLGYKQVEKDGSPLRPVEEQPQGAKALIAKIGYDRMIYVACGHTYRPDT
jgi:hypothetical protein